MSKDKPRRWSTKLSLRTLLLAIWTCAMSLGVFASPNEVTGALGTSLEVASLLALLLIVCVTFASIADDIWQDPASAFVGGLFGVLGFCAIVVIGMLIPTAL